MKLTQAWTLIASSAIAVGAFVVPSSTTHHQSPITTNPISTPTTTNLIFTTATTANINTLNKGKFNPLQMSDSATIVDAETVDESAETFE